MLAALVLAALAMSARQSAAETERVIAGREGYTVSGQFERWFGKGYRDLWTTPFDAEVVDLDTFAGGLTPLRQVGSMQSVGLAMKGADGRSYTFRILDKDPTKILPEAWRDTFPAKIFQDQTIAAHPGSHFVVPPLAKAAAIPHVAVAVVFMPDDPALGDFRETFGGKPGTIMEFPTPASETYGGFMEAQEILSTGELWLRWLDGSARVDTDALLRARLFDLFLGDWDRHNGQWKWLKLPDADAFVPFPEDRDNAFANFSGLALDLARKSIPQFIEWNDDYSNLGGLLFQGAELDRWLLSGAERSAFADAAVDLQTRLTDEAIETAVAALPPEWYEIHGAALARDLKRRRDLLSDVAERFYESLAGKVDIHATDLVDVASVTRGVDGSVELTLATEGGAAPYFDRRFLADETKELRLHLHGGDDLLTTRGPRDSTITLRVSGGPGRNQLDDTASGGTHFYDVSKDQVLRGPGTSVSTAEYEPVPYKPETPWMERDVGGLAPAEALIWWEPDPGIVLHLSKTFYRYGFRKHPYAQMHRVSLDYKTKRNAFKFAYHGEYQWARRGFLTEIELWGDGAKNYNFFGFGNESPNDQPDEFFEADQQQFYLFPSLVSYKDDRDAFRIALGPEAKFSRNLSPDDTLLNQTQPYGFGDFGQVGFRLSVRADTRGGAGVRTAGQYLEPEKTRPETGLKLELDATLYPEAWDVLETFGAVGGSVAGYWQAASWLTLAGRVGGRSVWGEYPWHESAFLGGSPDLRGYERNRFAGDQSLYANSELRFGLGAAPGLILPAEWGLFALYDVGRVWLDGEASDRWHPAWGGGLWLRLLVLDMTFHAAAAKGQDEDGVLIYANFGFHF